MRRRGSRLGHRNVAWARALPLQKGPVFQWHLPQMEAADVVGSHPAHCSCVFLSLCGSHHAPQNFGTQAKLSQCRCYPQSDIARQLEFLGQRKISLEFQPERSTRCASSEPPNHVVDRWLSMQQRNEVLNKLARGLKASCAFALAEQMTGIPTSAKPKVAYFYETFVSFIEETGQHGKGDNCLTNGNDDSLSWSQHIRD
jgi:hypothetical protein